MCLQSSCKVQYQKYLSKDPLQYMGIISSVFHIHTVYPHLQSGVTLPSITFQKESHYDWNVYPCIMIRHMVLSSSRKYQLWNNSETSRYKKKYYEVIHQFPSLPVPFSGVFCMPIVWCVCGGMCTFGVSPCYSIRGGATVAPVPVLGWCGSVGAGGWGCLVVLLLSAAAWRLSRAASCPSAAYLRPRSSTVYATHRLGLTRRALLLVPGRLGVGDGPCIVDSYSSWSCWGTSCYSVYVHLVLSRG